MIYLKGQWSIACSKLELLTVKLNPKKEKKFNTEKSSE